MGTRTPSPSHWRMAPPGIALAAGRDPTTAAVGGEGRGFGETKSKEGGKGINPAELTPGDRRRLRTREEPFGAATARKLRGSRLSFPYSSASGCQPKEDEGRRRDLEGGRSRFLSPDEPQDRAAASLSSLGQSRSRPGRVAASRRRVDPGLEPERRLRRRPPGSRPEERRLRGPPALEETRRRPAAGRG